MVRKIILYGCLALGFFFATYKVVISQSFYNPYPEICEFVESTIYIEPSKLENWMNLCRSREKLVESWSPKNLIIKDINNVFDQLKISHLRVYDEEDVQEHWQGQVKATGIEAAFVEGELVVFYVHQGSPAEAAGLRKYDVILSIDGEHPSEKLARTSSGLFKVQRGFVQQDVRINEAEFELNDIVEVVSQDRGQAVLRIPSFRESVFKDQNLTGVMQQLGGARDIVIDLRGNLGGNFYAGLEVLSYFFCESKVVGELIRPRFKDLPTQDLPFKLDDHFHIAKLKRSSRLRLVTPKQEHLCLKKPRAVLVDSQTSSVAELVALAFREHLSVPLLGSVTAGKLLVGMWYPWPELGRQVEVSVPEAYFESTQGINPEEKGVSPDQILYYRLSDFQKGQDSWLTQAFLFPSVDPKSKN